MAVMKWALFASSILLIGIATTWGAPAKNGDLAIAAITANDAKALENALIDLWREDPAEASRVTGLVLTGKQTWLRGTAADVAARKADVGTLVKWAKQLEPTKYRDERRLFVRALGSFRGEEMLEIIRGFLGDTDAYVVSAAIYALADTGRISTVEWILPKLDSQPPVRQKDVQGDAERRAINAAGYGAVLYLTNLRPESPQEVVTELKKARLAKDAISRGPDDRFASPPNNQRRSVYSYFEFSFTPQTAEDEMWATLKRQRITDPQALAKELSRCVEDVNGGISTVFGTLYPPMTPVEMKNDQSFGMGGSKAGHLGQASGNLMTLNVALFGIGFDEWQAALRHEFIHIIHATRYPNQPRWLAEGLACSYTVINARSSTWTARAIHREPTKTVEKLVRGGLFKGLDQWQQGMTSDRSGEYPMYQGSHVAVDYLRFGVISAAETRLAFLMGELSRGKNIGDAIMFVYGRTVDEMDQDVITWLGGTTAIESTSRPSRPAQPRRRSGY